MTESSLKIQDNILVGCFRKLLHLELCDSIGVTKYNIVVTRSKFDDIIKRNVHSNVAVYMRVGTDNTIKDIRIDSKYRQIDYVKVNIV